MSEIKQHSLTRREFLKSTKLVLGSLLIVILGACSPIKYLLREKEKIKSTKYEIKDVEKTEIEDALRPPGNLLISNKSKWAFMSDHDPEFLHQKILDQTAKKLDYSIDGYEFTFYANETSQFPSQTLLDNAYNFLQKYHNSFFQRNVSDTYLEPRRKSYYYFVDIPLEFTKDGKLNPSGGPVSYTDKSSVHPDTSHSVINLAADKMMLDLDSFWTEFAQSLDAVIETETWIDLYNSAIDNNTGIIIAEKRNNEFGFAMKAASLGLTYDEYSKIAKTEVYVFKRKIDLTPYDETMYEEVKKIFL